MHCIPSLARTYVQPLAVRPFVLLHFTYRMALQSLARCHYCRQCAETVRDTVVDMSTPSCIVVQSPKSTADACMHGAYRNRCRTDGVLADASKTATNGMAYMFAP
jgi:hypothetical protein